MGGARSEERGARGVEDWVQDGEDSKDAEETKEADEKQGHRGSGAREMHGRMGTGLAT